MKSATTIDTVKIPHGTPAWFDMVGTFMMDAAAQAKLTPDVNISLVEHYIDGAKLDKGLIQGLRFEIIGGRPSFRPGARDGEQGDITIKVSLAASHTLNTLYGDDPRFLAAFASLLADGEFELVGDLARLGPWFSNVHDKIVDRTL
jgi:hypothetical protein